MSSTGLKTTYAVQNKYDAFYTGGKVQVSSCGTWMFCQCGTQIKVLDINTGKVVYTVGKEDDDEITCFCVSPNDQMLVVACKNLLLKQWDWKTNALVRSWKAIHVGPISCMAFDVTSTLLATGSSDSTVKIWDMVHQYCTHNLTAHQGVVSALAYQQEGETLRLVTSADDCHLRVWDLKSSSCVGDLEGHYSVVTSLHVDTEARILYSAGRDNVVILWNLDKLTKIRTIPVYESVEDVIVLPKKKIPDLNILSDDDRFFITAGSKGVLRVWNSVTGVCIYNDSAPVKKEVAEGEDATQHQHSIIQASLQPQLNVILTVTFSHNITLYRADTLQPQKHFVGNTDDILDAKFLGPSDSHLVVATNSELIKVFELATWNCQVLAGHTDIVMAIDVYKDGSMFVSASKDNSIRVWWFNEETGAVRCVAVGQGHTHAVLSVAFSRLSCSFVVTGSQDSTIKLWPLPEAFPASGPPAHLTSIITEHAHDKDINSITVAPNDKLVATGSLDRTAKLWRKDDMKLLGVLRGHKRGIWCVQFSPVDQCLATTSADSTIKLWALADYTCVKTFEGHQSSVLRVSFLTRGMQLLSSGSDGLLKLWTLKTNECVQTVDAHDDKVWALACSRGEDRVVTGAGDATIILWKDVTEEQQVEERAKQENFIVKEQKLANLIHEKKWAKALGLTITLDQPFKALTVIRALLEEPEGHKDLEQLVLKLRVDQIDALLRYSSEWNTNSRNCNVAQTVINVTLHKLSSDTLLKLPNIKQFVEAVIPYTERHLERLNRLQQQACFVDYTWQTMKLKENLSSDEVGSASEVQANLTIDRHGTCQKAQLKESSSSESESDEEVPKPMQQENQSADESDSDVEMMPSRTAAETEHSSSNEEQAEDDLQPLSHDIGKENTPRSRNKAEKHTTPQEQTAKRQKTPKTAPVKKSKALTGTPKAKRRRSIAK